MPSFGGGGGGGGSANAQRSVDALMQLVGSNLMRPAPMPELDPSMFAVDDSLFSVERNTALDDRINQAEAADLERAMQAYAGMPAYDQNRFDGLEFTQNPQMDDSLLSFIAAQGGDPSQLQGEMATMQAQGDADMANWNRFAEAMRANVATDQDAYGRDQEFARRSAEDMIRGSAFGLRGQADAMHQGRVDRMSEARRAAQMQAQQMMQAEQLRRQQMEQQMGQQYRDNVMALLQQIIGTAGAGGVRVPDLSGILGGVY